MKKGTLLVVRKPYQGDTVIQNTLNYAIGSLFADEEDILTSHIDNEDDSDQIIEEYYRLQAPYNMTDHILSNTVNVFVPKCECILLIIQDIMFIRCHLFDIVAAKRKVCCYCRCTILCKPDNFDQSVCRDYRTAF